MPHVAYAIPRPGHRRVDCADRGPWVWSRAVFRGAYGGNRAVQPGVRLRIPTHVWGQRRSVHGMPEETTACRRRERTQRGKQRHKDPGRRQAVVALSLLLALAAGIAAPGAGAADTYYRWKDERGKLVVSDRPPTDPDIEYEVVSQRSSLVRRVRSGEGAVPPEVVPRPGNRSSRSRAASPRWRKTRRPVPGPAPTSRR
jgi:hypothetical protein